jgi:hypothetical protein
MVSTHMNRPQLCEAYELALRSSGSVLRPVHNIVATTGPSK